MNKAKEQRERQQHLEQDTIAYSRFVEQLMDKYQLAALNFYHINSKDSVDIHIARITLENSSSEVSEEVKNSVYQELTKFLFSILGHTKRLDINAYCHRGVIEPRFNEMVENRRKSNTSKVTKLILYRDRKITSNTKDPVSDKVARHWFVSSALKTPSREYLLDYLLDSDEER